MQPMNDGTDTIETILREQVKMWRHVAHVEATVLVIMCLAVIVLALII